MSEMASNGGKAGGYDGGHDDGRWVVNGIVRAADGTPQPRLKVVAFNKDLRSEQQLGQATTGASGAYEIDYQPPRAPRPPEVADVDVFVRVYDANGAVTFTSDVVFSAEKKTTIDCTIGGTFVGPSEYSTVFAAVTRHLDGVALTDLQEDDKFQDVSFLASQLKLDGTRISYVVAAARLEVETRVPTAAFYGMMREGLPTDLSAILLQSAGAQTHALETALAANVIAAIPDWPASKIVASLQALAIQRATDPGSGGPQLGPVLAMTLPEPQQRQTFLTRFANFSGSTSDFWSSLSQDPTFSSKVPAIQFSLQLGALTGNHVPLVGMLHDMQHSGKITDLRDLARLDTAAWTKLISTSQNGRQPVGVPADVPGTDPTDRTTNYAQALSLAMEHAFPTVAVTARLAMDAQPGLAGALAFLQRNPAFDLATTSVDRFVAANPGAAAGLDQSAVEQARMVHRVYKVASNYDQMAALISAGFTSAYSIARLDAGTFVKAHAAALGGPAVAARVHNNARQVHLTALHLLATFGPQFNSVSPAVLVDFGGPRNLAAEQPDWAKLFGSLDMCDCRDCRSVLSPAAYLVDTLHFLHDRGAVPPLFQRRADIGDIELTCENTNTPMPYVDLVNEVLENAIAPPAAFASFALPNTIAAADLDTGQVSAALRAAFTPPLSAAAVLAVENPGRDWRIEEAPYTYRVRLDGGALRVVSRGQQTTASADELAANPQYTNASAYDALGGSVYPWQLPFDLWTAEVRTYLGFLGVARADLMTAFQQRGVSSDPTDVAIATERLGLTPAERAIVTGAPLTPPRTAPEFWGFAAADPNWVAELRPVPQILARSGLAYEELLTLLRTAFCNPGAALQITAPNECDISTQVLDMATDADFDRFYRFVRLWRRVGWSMHDLDRAIVAFRGTVAVGQRLDDQLLVDLAAAQAIAKQLSLPAESVLGLWSNVDTTAPAVGADSLFARLFQNPTVLQPPDPAFALNAAGTELQAAGTEHVSGHVPAIVAAAGISAEDLSLIQASRLPDDALSLANLSRIVRIASLARSLGLSIADLVTLEACAGIDPLDPADVGATLRFVETARRVRASGVSIAELDYLLRHQFSAAAAVAPTDFEVGLVLDEIRTGLQKIAAENQPVHDATGDAVRRKLARLPNLTAARVDQAMSLLDRSWADPTAEKQFIDDHLASFLDPTDAKAQLVGPPPALGTAADRYAYVLSALLAHLTRIQGEGFVVQKLGETLKLGVTVAAELLLQRVRSRTQAGATMIADFLDHTFATSDPAASPLSDPNQVAQAAVSFARQFQAYRLLGKVATVIDRFAVTPGELVWLFDYGPSVGWLDLNALPLAATTSGAALFAGWRRVLDLFTLRNQLPLGEAALTAIFTAARQPGVAIKDLLDMVSARTLWNRQDLADLVGVQGLGLAVPEAFQDETALIRLRACFDVLGRLGASAVQCRAWAQLALTSDAGAAAKRTVKAKYSVADWPDIARPLRDELRERQRSSLVAYLVAHPEVAATAPHWTDANGVYEHYLIDVEMSPCMLTSRIKQAIGSVQQFVQRCLFNLESGVNVDPSWREWKWRKHYRVWQANREIFLWPENWVQPELRTDKSPFFKDFENELLQSDLTTDTAEEAFLHYLESLDAVARLDIVGLTHQVETDQHGNPAIDVVHVFGRTRNTPHVYYYRRREDGAWTAWEKVALDIQGDHIVPVIWNRRLYLTWVLFTEKTADSHPNVRMPAPGASVDPVPRYLEAQLAWSEYKRGKWGPKRMSREVLTSPAVTAAGVTDPALYTVRTAVTAAGDLQVLVVQDSYGTGALGRFVISGCDGTVAVKDLAHTVTSEGTFWILAPRRADVSGTKFLEKEGSGGNDSLYLTSLSPQVQDSFDYTALHKGEMDIQTLFVTPGVFDLVVPAQHPQFASQDVFFYEDTTRSFFVEPRDQFVFWRVPHWWDVLTITPTIGSSVIRAYYRAAAVDSPPTIAVAAADPPLAAITWPARASTTSGPGAAVAGALATLTFNQAYHSILDTAITFNPEWWWLYAPEKRYRFSTHYHPFVCQFVRELNRDGVDGLMQRPAQVDPLSLVATPPPQRFSFHDTYLPESVAWPVVDSDAYPQEDVDFQPDGAYSLYNWELLFHAPLLIAERLTQNQRFEDAQRWFHYMFDPTDTSQLESPRRYWRTRPFFEATAADYRDQQIDHLLQLIDARSADPNLAAQIKAMEDYPFEPHRIARFRITAYQKTTVMKYLDNLIAWGDQLFRQDTIETINEATQLYVLAAQILGPRPTVIEAHVQPQAETYNTLAPRLDDFSDASVAVEAIVPVPPADAPLPVQEQAQVTLPPMLYFCVPANQQLLGYWDTVADRLFKIRHCQNIEGVTQQLPLFEPPINPALLVRAAAAGVDLSSALSDVNAPVPHYRFTSTAQKATELCAEVKSLGAALLAALEKRDGEMLALLRSTHEISVLQAARRVREQQIEEAQDALDGLNRNRELVGIRLAYYQNIAFLNPAEAGQLQMATQSLAMQLASADIDLVANVLGLIPDLKIGTPTTIGATFGGSNLAQGLRAMGSYLSSLASVTSAMGAISGTMGGHQRRFDDWKLQERLAAKELEQIDRQIAAAEVRLAVAQQELANQDLQISNAQQLDETMRDKFTAQDLYDWTLTQLSSIHFQAYGLAYDVAKRAERAYRYELGLDDSSFIQFGYWDSLKKGLLAGERLSADLKRMEASYLDANQREYELTKHVSLATLNPLALASLKLTGSCVVDLPETLFDLDYPGHYMRRIKSVAVTVPCVVGPYTGVNCVLTLNKNRVRRSSDPSSPRFVDSVGAVQSIVTSSAQSDAGLFETNLHDERYLPFEGCGAISTWTIRLDPDTNAFDLDTVADVVLHIRYTAREGGEQLRSAAKAALPKTGARLFSLKRDFPSEWYGFRSVPETGTGDHVQVFGLNQDRFPFRAQKASLALTTVHLFAVATGGAPAPFPIHLTPAGKQPNQATDRVSLQMDPALGNMLHADVTYAQAGAGGWTLRVLAADWAAAGAELDDLWLVTEYQLK